MPRRPSKKNRRAISGILLLDKPKGITSNHALQRAKNFYKAAKAGHTGSLDPLATGVLPLCFGEGTKVSSYLLDADKHYTTVARLGVVTNTADADGEVIETHAVPKIETSILESIFEEFRGGILQVPPMYSALHHEGKRLYELARKGVTVVRPPRAVTISKLHLSAYDETSLTLDVSCSKGTYIRSLVEDIGAKLGCGAHVEVLRRTGVDPFVNPPLVSLEQLEELAVNNDFEAMDKLLIPVDKALSGWESIHLNDEQTYLMRTGRSFVWGSENTDVKIYDCNGQFMGLGLIENGLLKPKRLMAEGQHS